MNPDLPVLESIKHELDIIVIGKIIIVISQTVLNLSDLLLGQESSSLGVIGKSPESDDSHDDGEKTLEDENPSPSGPSSKSGHLVDTSREKTSEGTGDGSGGEEDGGAESTLASAVPEGDVVVYTGEETGFGDSEEDSGNN